jgi:predicted anti-sigma-YlaC factor YlaD
VTKEEAAETILDEEHHLDPCSNCRGMFMVAGKELPDTPDAKRHWRPSTSASGRILGWACYQCNRTGLVFSERYLEACKVLDIMPTRGNRVLTVYDM